MNVQIGLFLHLHLYVEIYFVLQLSPHILYFMTVSHTHFLLPRCGTQTSRIWKFSLIGPNTNFWSCNDFYLIMMKFVFIMSNI